MNTARLPSIDNLRRRATKIGLRIEKSRIRNVHVNNLGGFQLIDAWSNTVVDGANYELEHADLASRIERLEAEQ